MGVENVLDRSIPWRVGMEECMKHFFTGQFNANGLVKLAQMNGIVSFACFRWLGGVSPVHIHPHTARGFFDLKQNKKKSGLKRDIKEIILEYVQNLVDKEKLDLPPITHDIADSFVIARYTFLWHWILEHGCQMPELQNAFYEAYLDKNRNRLEKKFTDVLPSAQIPHQLQEMAHTAYLNAFIDWMKEHEQGLFPLKAQE